MAQTKMGTLEKTTEEWKLLNSRLKGIVEEDSISTIEYEEFSDFKIVYVTLSGGRKLGLRDLSKLILIPELESIQAHERFIVVQFYIGKNKNEVPAADEGKKRFKFFQKEE